MIKREGGSRSDADQWTHRQAIQVIGLLPDNQDQALAILERARFLLKCWDLQPEDFDRSNVERIRPKLVTG